MNLGELGKTLGIPEGSQFRKVKDVNNKIRKLLRSQNFCVVIHPTYSYVDLRIYLIPL